jgi:16S rRNA G966 N2-methylase RsmD
MEGAEVLTMDALDAIRFLSNKGRKFDIVFLDPPYSAGLAEKALQSLEAYDILQSSGFVCVQHFKKNLLPQAFGPFQLWREARYGDTVLSFYKRTGQEG